MLRYLLVVLTHGASTTLPRTLDSFREQVTPAPAEALLYVDGPDVGDAAYDAMVGRGIPWTIGGESEQHGFCDAVANAWADAVGSEGAFDHVFWLENDFVFRRPVDLNRLADLRHRSFFSTNPSLLRRDFMVENPWPADGEPFCEGRFGLELVQKGYSFGIWGDGDIWVDHIGRREGFGY
jgi:hypothetical protein